MHWLSVYGVTPPLWIRVPFPSFRPSLRCIHAMTKQTPSAEVTLRTQSNPESFTRLMFLFFLLVRPPCRILKSPCSGGYHIVVCSCSIIITNPTIIHSRSRSCRLIVHPSNVAVSYIPLGIMILQLCNFCKMVIPTFTLG